MIESSGKINFSPELVQLSSKDDQTFAREIFDVELFSFLAEGEEEFRHNKKHKKNLDRRTDLPYHEKRWFHLYINEEKKSVEEYGKMSLLGEFTFFPHESSKKHKKYTFRLAGASPDEENIKIRRLHSKLLKISKSFSGFENDSIDARIVWHESASKKEICEHRYFHSKDTPEADKTKVEDITRTHPHGKVCVMHTYALSDFLGKGSCGLKNTICDIYEYLNLQNETFIDVSNKESEYIYDGQDFSVFRRILKSRDWLGRRTYRRDSDGTSYFLRLSKMGVIEVREEYTLGGDFLAVLERLIGYRLTRSSRINRKKEVSLDEVVQSFVQQIFDEIEKVKKLNVKNHVDGAEDNELDAYLKNTYAYRQLRLKLKAPLNYFEELKREEFKNKVDEEKRQFIKKRRNLCEIFQGTNNPLNSSTENVHKKQSYIVLLLSDVKCNICANCGAQQTCENCRQCKKTIEPSQICENMRLIQSLIEGTLILSENEDKTSIPKLPERKGEITPDKSTWQNELCVFGTERCLMYFEPKTVLEAEGKVANYIDYWQYMIRGIELTISIRTSLQMLESETETYIHSVPGLVKKFNTSTYGENKRQIDKELDSLTLNVADALSSLPSLREVCVPSSVFRSVDVIEKFAFLNEKCFRFSDVLRHIQQNFDELTGFLTFFKQQQLQLETNMNDERKANSDRRLGLIAMAFTVMSIGYVFSTYVKDAKELEITAKIAEAPVISPFLTSTASFLGQIDPSLAGFERSELLAIIFYFIALSILILVCTICSISMRAKNKRSAKRPADNGRELL